VISDTDDDEPPRQRQRLECHYSPVSPVYDGESDDDVVWGGDSGENHDDDDDEEEEESDVEDDDEGE